MNDMQKNGTMIPVTAGFARCPVCARGKHSAKLVRITPTTQAKGLHLFCRYCKTEFTVDIDNGQCFESRSL